MLSESSENNDNNKTHDQILLWKKKQQLRIHHMQRASTPDYSGSLIECCALFPSLPQPEHKQVGPEPG